MSWENRYMHATDFEQMSEWMDAIDDVIQGRTGGSSNSRIRSPSGRRWILEGSNEKVGVEEYPVPDLLQQRESPGHVVVDGRDTNTDNSTTTVTNPLQLQEVVDPDELAASLAKQVEERAEVSSHVPCPSSPCTHILWHTHWNSKGTISLLEGGGVDISSSVFFMGIVSYFPLWKEAAVRVSLFGGTAPSTPKATTAAGKEATRGRGAGTEDGTSCCKCSSTSCAGG